MSIDIAAGLIPNGAGVPAVCSRHGEPAVLRKRVKFQSKPPGWAYALLIAGALPFLIVVLVMRKEVQAEAWPFCAQCQQMHKTRTLLGLALFLPLVLIFVLAFANPDGGGGPALVVLMFATIFGSIGGIVALARGGYRMLSQGFVARDGNSVGFAKAHPAFAAEARAAYDHAARQYAAQQAAYAQQYAQQQQQYAQQQPQA
ncbi:hypothetical protein [Actinoplanes sp. NPDC026623]|uniref:hypothetical protein n=1 Tax=Actinoplanes sp. NPDC026623 TaxID=3155610 RepID=UPI0033F906CC